MLRVIEFDFESKKERLISPESLQASPAPGIYYWIHAEDPDETALAELLGRLLPDAQISLPESREDPEELLEFHSDYIALTFSESVFSDHLFSTEPFQVVLGGHFLGTLSKPGSTVARQVLDQYRNDFQNFAKSPGFLLFEVVDALYHNYQRTYRGFEAEIGRLQNQLFEKTNEQHFLRVARATKQMLEFQFTIVDARDLITAIATRKSPFIRETTQPFLEQKGNLIGRMGDDVSTQRDAIANTLNLYVGFIGFRSNQIINRLTIISLIFLPLTFLVGVYGMNFTHMPEIDWPYSYPLFWAVVLVIVVGLLLYFKHKRWLQL